MARWPTWEQKAKAFEWIGYKPHGGQLKAHRSGARVIAAFGAERGGKSCWAGREAFARMPWCKRIAVAGQEYDECRPEMRYLLRDLDAIGAIEKRSTPQTGKWQIQTRTGCEIETISLHDGAGELTGRGEPYDLVLIVEAGRVRYDAFLAARGRTSETRGDVLLVGTLWDDWGWYADMYNSFQAPNIYEGQGYSFPAWDNRAIFPGGETDAEIERLRAILPEGEFARRVAAKLVPSPARIYPEFNFPTHVERVPFDDRLPVELAVDAGYYPSRYAVLALQVAQETITLDDGSALTMDVVRQVGEVYENQKTHHDIVEMCAGKEWWPRVTTVVGGHETKQHQANKSTAEVWDDLMPQWGLRGVRFQTFDAGGIMDGVMRVKTMLKDPWTHKPRYRMDLTCDGTAREFQAYKRKTDSRGNVTSEEPVDADNDALDALRDWMVYRFGFVEGGTRGVVQEGRRRLPARG